MKKIKLYLQPIFLCCLVTMLSQLGSGQGLHVENGSELNATGNTTGRAIFGDNLGFHMAVDGDDIQARSSSSAATLFLNYYGGSINLLGAANTVGDLSVDGSGLYYDNASDFLGLGTFFPTEKIDVVNGDMRIETASGSGGGLRLYQPDLGVYGNVEVEQFGVVGELTMNMSVNWANGGGTRNTNYDGGFMRIDTRVGPGLKGFQWTWVPANGTEQNLMTLRDNGHLQLRQSVNDEMVIINDDIWTHSSGDQDFGNGGDHFCMASREGSAESAGVYGDGNSLAFWSAGDGNSGQPAALAYFLDEDFFNTANTNPYDNSALKAYIATNGVWTVSDQNKKENVVRVDHALHKILQLNAYAYDYVRNTKEIEKNAAVESAVGVMAQELKEVIPEAVQQNIDGEHFVNYNMIIPVLIEAIKEQQAKIDILESKID